MNQASIYDRHLNKTRASEVSLSAYAFLYSEIVQYSQKNIKGIQALEQKLSDLGYKVGSKMIELVSWREKSFKREIKILGILSWIHTTLWKHLFGKVLDALEKSTENEDEYMLSDNEPMVFSFCNNAGFQFISVPRDMSSFNAAAFIAGIIEAVLDGSQFKARVSAHSTGNDAFPSRTTFLIKFDKSVIKRSLTNQ